MFTLISNSARRQLAFDIWWLALSLWLVCIIEVSPLSIQLVPRLRYLLVLFTLLQRGHLQDESRYDYFTIFSVLFEMVSAYGTVGLSLGVSYDNFSYVNFSMTSSVLKASFLIFSYHSRLSGAFRKLSKLVVIVVMIRGRHRGLPVAVSFPNYRIILRNNMTDTLHDSPQIDRAIMLPKDFTETEETAFYDEQRRLSMNAQSLDRINSNLSGMQLNLGSPRSGARGRRRTSRGSLFSELSPEAPFTSSSNARSGTFPPEPPVLDLNAARKNSAATTGSAPDAVSFTQANPVLSGSNAEEHFPMRSLNTIKESALSRAPTFTKDAGE